VHYAEFRPADRLRDLVDCTWERRVPDRASPASSRVVPDGCVDFVFRRGELILAGPDRGPFTSPLEPGETVVGLRLRPGAAGGLLGLEACELRDRRPALEDVWGRAGAELAERVGDAGTAERRRHELSAAVLACRRDAGDLDPVVAAAVRMLGRPGTRVAALGATLGIGERQLLRRFDAAVGYGPKLLDRVLRFQRFVSRAPAVADDGGHLARVAAELGYADQAHLSRDCKRLSGLTPSQLARGAAPHRPDTGAIGRGRRAGT
jgi:AraC-like DNA-binding protein